MPDASTIESWLKDRISKELKVSPAEVDIATPFDDMGLDSLAVLTTTGDLAEWLDRPLEAETLFRHPTIESLSAHLAS